MTSESQPSGQKATKPPKQILIIRHGEKPGDSGVDSKDDGPDLSTKGYERAAALAFKLPAAFGRIDHLFAAQKSTNSNRPVETLTPLRKALKLKLNHDFKDDDYQGIADHILGNPKYLGARLVICWHHSKIPQLAAKLNVANPPSPWPDEVFDRVWIIDYDTGGGAGLKNVPQQLLYGDSDS